jgi:hypothetical protein
MSDVRSFHVFISTVLTILKRLWYTFYRYVRRKWPLLILRSFSTKTSKSLPSSSFSSYQTHHIFVHCILGGKLLSLSLAMACQFRTLAP